MASPFRNNQMIGLGPIWAQPESISQSYGGAKPPPHIRRRSRSLRPNRHLRYNGALRNDMAIPSTRLVNILIGKSIIETLVVGALAVFTFMSVLPPYFRGSAEATTTGISGWAVSHASPAQRVDVQLFIDGKFVA